jgi:hypothetical protein
MNGFVCKGVPFVEIALPTTVSTVPFAPTDGDPVERIEDPGSPAVGGWAVWKGVDGVGTVGDPSVPRDESTVGAEANPLDADEGALGPADVADQGAVTSELAGGCPVAGPDAGGVPTFVGVCACES